MTLAPLTVIEASAGTGKTFALVTRLLTLIFHGVAPERIVALTFSRLAAGEIFNSFIERLARAARDASVAAAEADRIDPGHALPARPDQAAFARMLRLVIARQHLSLIGTLDSFLMRIVRMIPAELGLDGELRVMSDYRSPVERLRLVGEMMMRDAEGVKTVFRESFRLAYDAPGARSFLDGFSDFIARWHTRYRDLPEPSAWGDAGTIWGAEEGASRSAACGLAEIRAAAAELAPFAAKRGVATFIAAVEGFSGTLPATFPKALASEPAALRIWRLMLRWRLAASLRTTRGMFLLMSAYEAAYATAVRRRGLITFDDLPRLLNALPEAVRLPLEYRMDAHFDHWALDEFQDTSRGQWRAVSNLIRESSMREGEKSVFIVGDRKQSIYDWRGGDVRILGEQVDAAGAPPNERVYLDESYRYRPAIAEAVNRVFGEATVRGAFDMDHVPSGCVWHCREHRSHDRREPGYVSVMTAPKAGRTVKASDFFAPVYEQLAAVRPWERGLTCAVLVRRNDFGEALRDYLRERGIASVVFEGESAIADSPVIGALEELVYLAEHADDVFAWEHLRCTPLARALWPDGMPAAPAASAELLGAFTRLGLVRFFREVREKLKAVPESWNDFVESRFEDFLRAAAEFEDLRDASLQLCDFLDYVDRRTRRDYASPGMVRIMTVHQSKGLGFDFVILPLFEYDALVNARHAEPLVSEHPAWILENPGAEVTSDDPVLAQVAAAGRAAQRYDALCLYYVAMTRAKRALSLILHPAPAKPAPEPARFSDLVRLVGLQTIGDPAWYTTPPPPSSPSAPPPTSPSAPPPTSPSAPPPTSPSAPPPTVVGATPAPGAPPPPPPRAPRRTLRRVRPSEDYYTGLTADTLFTAGYGSAARRGIELHERLAAIEWLPAPGTSLPSAFLPAFTKPAPDAVVWRERSYELFVNGVWESGQFDRVVLTRDAAVIYDFKTNRRHEDEDFAAFAARMRRTYAGQMRAYRAALAQLTGRDPATIRTILLLTDTGTRAEVLD